MSNRQREKERRRQQRLAREAAERRAGQRRRRVRVAGAAAAVVVAAALAVVLATSAGGRHSGSSSTTGSGLLASTAGEASGSTVDGIRCQTMEQAIFHIHAHLAIYVNGRERRVPEGIGIPGPRQVQQTSDGPFVVGGACFYWLHSHTGDGIIHIESPVQRVFTLGDYFDVWKQPLTPSQVGPAKGKVTAYLDGKPYTRDPRSIPLAAHAVIQLDVGRPLVRPQPFTFPQGL